MSNYEVAYAHVHTYHEPVLLACCYCDNFEATVTVQTLKTHMLSHLNADGFIRYPGLKHPKSRQAKQ